MYKVFTLDARNHGDSEHADSMSYPEMAEDVAEFLKSHQINQVHLVGHSMGGKIAMTLALTKVNHRSTTERDHNTDQLV